MLPHANANLKKTGLAKTTTCSRRWVMSGWDEERIMGTWESDVMFEVLIVWTLPFVQPTLACALLTASKSRFETNLKAFRKWFDMTWIPCFACIPALAFSHFHYLAAKSARLPQPVQLLLDSHSASKRCHIWKRNVARQLAVINLYKVRRCQVQHPVALLEEFQCGRNGLISWPRLQSPPVFGNLGSLPLSQLHSLYQNQAKGHVIRPSFPPTKTRITYYISNINISQNIWCANARFDMFFFLFRLPQGIKGIGCFWLRTSKQWRETDLNEAKTDAGKSFKKYT